MHPLFPPNLVPTRIRTGPPLLQLKEILPIATFLRRAGRLKLGSRVLLVRTATPLKQGPSVEKDIVSPDIRPSLPHMLV